MKNAQGYFAVDALGVFFAGWGMPLIFVISGASVFYALGKRGPGLFLKDRTLACSFRSSDDVGRRERASGARGNSEMSNADSQVGNVN